MKLVGVAVFTFLLCSTLSLLLERFRTVTAAGRLEVWYYISKYLSIYWLWLKSSKTYSNIGCYVPPALIKHFSESSSAVAESLGSSMRVCAGLK